MGVKRAPPLSRPSSSTPRVARARELCPTVDKLYPAAKQFLFGRRAAVSNFLRTRTKTMGEPCNRGDRGESGENCMKSGELEDDPSTLH